MTKILSTNGTNLGNGKCFSFLQTSWKELFDNAIGRWFNGKLNYSSLRLMCVCVTYIVNTVGFILLGFHLLIV